MFQHYTNLLAGAVAHPDCPLSQLPLLGEAERHQMIVAWNQTDRPYPRKVCVTDLLAPPVQVAPEAIALKLHDQAVTYRELDTRANRLGHHLQKHGVGPDVPVALCMEPGLEMLVGVLGVIKAGGAYVPLDPAWPRERLDVVLRQTRAPVLLTLDRHRGALPGTGSRVICLDRDWPQIDGESAQPPVSGICPEHLIWVIYTSGSTGQPKGVMIPHRAACNYLFWMREEFGWAASDRVLQLASLSFDVAVVELLAPWSVGARVVLPKPETQYDPGALVAAVIEHGITILQVVPSMLRLLVERDDFAACTSLRLVFCGGEPMTPELRDAFFAARPGTQLYNMYGPTETCVDATYWACAPDDAGTHVPIGRPLANARAHILDPRGQPVPIGVRGELYVGGAGLGRGYLEDPRLTGEKFVPDPFQPGTGERLYRTGDAARYRPDGAIEFLGRLDHQVKIHGLRIELEEIEAHLEQHAGVRQCVVVARDEGTGEKRLVAYVARRPGHELDAAAARGFLEGKLPGHMVPPVFVFVESFALLPSGKVDRRGLPAPEAARAVMAAAAESWNTPVEEQVAAIWGQVLHLEEVRGTDHFFELGGHSLLATQVMSRLEKVFQIQLPLRVLFENPTVSAFSRAMIQMEAKPGQTEKIALLLRRIDTMSAEEKQARLGRTRASVDGNGVEIATTQDV